MAYGYGSYDWEDQCNRTKYPRTKAESLYSTAGATIEGGGVSMREAKRILKERQTAASTEPIKANDDLVLQIQEWKRKADLYDKLSVSLKEVFKSIGTEHE